MAKKTFKIGEYAKGGIITAEIHGKKIYIIGKDWDHAAGDRRSSDQSNAKEWTRLTVEASDTEAYRKMYDFLIDITTHYYSEQVIDWIKSRVTLASTYSW